jgi:hypothetical protein
MQLAATPAAPVAAVQMAAGGDDRIVLGAIVKAWEAIRPRRK